MMIQCLVMVGCVTAFVAADGKRMPDRVRPALTWVKRNKETPIRTYLLNTAAVWATPKWGSMRYALACSGATPLGDGPDGSLAGNDSPEASPSSSEKGVLDASAGLTPLTLRFNCKGDDCGNSRDDWPAASHRAVSKDA